MESLTPRERVVMAAMASFARKMGRWASVREMGAYVAAAEGKKVLSVASTMSNLYRKGYISKAADGSFILKGKRIEVLKVRLVDVQ